MNVSTDDPGDHDNSAREKISPKRFQPCSKTDTENKSRLFSNRHMFSDIGFSVSRVQLEILSAHVYTPIIYYEKENIQLLNQI